MAERKRPTDYSISLGVGLMRQPDGIVATTSGYHGRIQEDGHSVLAELHCQMHATT